MGAACVLFDYAIDIARFQHSCGRFFFWERMVIPLAPEVPRGRLRLPEDAEDAKIVVFECLMALPSIFLLTVVTNI